jgi:hypothetical protein
LLLLFWKSTQAPLQRLKPLLHANVQLPSTQAGVALPTLVEHEFPHPPQLCTSDDVFTHEPLHSVGSEEEHPDTHVELEHAGVPLSGAQTWPQLEQLLRSLVVLTQTPLQSV